MIDYGKDGGVVGVGTEDAWDAIVLAGGRARRLGGVDKAALEIGDRSLLGIALAACAGARYRVVVGPQRLTDEPVRWALESPAGSGPLAALGAGLAAATWLSTMLIQIPQHGRLSPEGVPALVAGSWVRTIAWTAHSGVVLVMLAAVD